MSASPPASLIDALALHVPGKRRFSALGGGRTNHVWRVDTHEEALVLKLYSGAAHTPLFRNDPCAEWACLTQLSGTGLAPEPVELGVSEVGRWILYRHVAGKKWHTGTTQVALRLHELHRRSAPDLLHGASGGSVVLERQTYDMLAGTKGYQVDQLVDLAPSGTIPPVDRLCLIHGDPVPGNLVQQGENLTFIDWQCPALGDPCEDLAVFLSPAMQEIYRGAPLTDQEVQAFLTVYPDRNVVARYMRLAAWFHWRMAAYCLWKVAKGEAAYASGFTLEREALAGLVADYKS